MFEKLFGKSNTTTTAIQDVTTTPESAALPKFSTDSLNHQLQESITAEVYSSNDVPVTVDAVRDTRKMLLSHCLKAKHEAFTSVIRDVTKKLKPDADLEQVKSIENQVIDIESEVDSLSADNAALQTLHDTDDYGLYSYLSAKKKEQENSSVTKIINKAEQQLAKLRLDKLKKLVFALACSFICMVIDFNIIYSMFEVSNLGNGIVNSLFIVGAIDLPPFLMAFFLVDAFNCKSMLMLMNESPSCSTVEKSALTRQKRIDTVFVFLLLILTLLFMSIYIAVRFLMMFSGNLDSEESEISVNLLTGLSFFLNIEEIPDTTLAPVDGFLLLLPIVTSIVSAIGSIKLFKDEAAGIKSFAFIMKTEISKLIMDNKTTTTALQKAAEQTRTDAENKRREIWTYCFGESEFDKAAFTTKVYKSFVNQTLPVYKETYIGYCQSIRFAAEEALLMTKKAFLSICSDPVTLQHLEINDEEQVMLNAIYNPDALTQSGLTEQHLHQIEALTNNVFHS